MAWAIQFKEKAVTSGGYISQAPRQVATQAYKTYDARVYNTSGTYLNNLFTEFDVLEDSNLPVVNETLFQWFSVKDTETVENRLIPWLICTNKRAERDQGARNLFRVTCEYSTFNKLTVRESELYALDVSTLGQITAWSKYEDIPAIVETVWGEESKIIEEEAVDSPGADPAPLKLPNGNYYAEPFRRRYPRRTIRQSQFEVIPANDTALRDEIEERLFSIQWGCSFQGDPIPNTDEQEDEPPRWMITQIDYQRVRTPIGMSVSGGNLYIMTYTLERASGDGGWYDRRALIDYYYLETAGDLTSKKAYRDPEDQNSIIQAQLETDGTLMTNQDDPLEWVNYVTQKRSLNLVGGGTGWADFLQGAEGP